MHREARAAFIAQYCVDDPALGSELQASRAGGRQIAFQRRVRGHLQIFVVNANSTAQRRPTELSPVACNGYSSCDRRRGLHAHAEAVSASSRVLRV